MNYYIRYKSKQKVYEVIEQRINKDRNTHKISMVRNRIIFSSKLPMKAISELLKNI